ncbi:sugar ABC transporter substrate-binding protein [Spirilliplanes yamanashiensis]|uniref:Sugar ABC transporter substrate-binding protein n=1 Tax=Spirilliplanes yamanashiensis TaxID=42233 RepID=A0A8J4DJT9_9ACTN|nr:substrate-binding domain-containing protein [Spirilliplanes yamanashiensis]MDP9815940.1 D-xylose transport system substrate-binding protein [Spirilliplanes yamanashiensis]GIJ04196.1 sugar ABC transporter substrate-binding protein [Spirilliplanes yamanashiensis]
MRSGIALATTGLLLMGSLAACSDDADSSAPKTPKIGVILPDKTTSIRWETADRKYLQQAFDEAGIAHDIQNAEADKKRFQQIADSMIKGGVTVLMIVNLDSITGKVVLNQAAAAGVATVDYDRLTLNGGASYYVSFDNRGVGTLQGEGLVKCLEAQTPKKAKPVIATLNGSPSDNNATHYKNGYNAVLEDRYFNGDYTKGPDQDVQDWDNNLAGTIFEQMLNQTKNKIDGVLAANDGLAGAVIKELEQRNLNGQVPVTGQDADVAALQRILKGDQCMTVFKDTKKEAQAAAELAISLAKKQPKPAPTTVKDTESGLDVQSVLLKPEAIFKENVKTVVEAGYVTREALCKGAVDELCRQQGI